MIEQLFWEDLEVGAQAVSPGRTVTEADLMAFAGLSGDFNSVHVDATFAAVHGLGGERLVHGLLGLSIASGLFTRTWLGIGLQEQMIAMLHIDWSFRGPLRVGDTIRLAAEIVDRRETSKPERGITIVQRRLLNQDDAVIQEGRITTMMKRRAAPT